MRETLTGRNAHASRTPHHVGQTTKASITIAALLAGAPDPDQLAARIVDAVLDLGWTPPRDPNADKPTLQGPGADPDSPGRRAFREARAALAQRAHSTSTSGGRGAH